MRGLEVFVNASDAAISIETAEESKVSCAGDGLVSGMCGGPSCGRRRLSKVVALEPGRAHVGPRTHLLMRQDTSGWTSGGSPKSPGAWTLSHSYAVSGREGCWTGSVIGNRAQVRFTE